VKPKGTAPILGVKNTKTKKKTAVLKIALSAANV